MILFASNNPGKVKEMKAILKGFEILSLKELNVTKDVLEDADTFVGNATKKAEEILALGVCDEVIADDSGLEIDYLHGFPGVKTARFLGENKTPRERNLYLLEQLKNLPKQNRTCSAVCVLVYVNNFGKKLVAEGRLKGFVAEKVVEGNSFGFDEIFELSDGRVMSELSMVEKNQISARTLAAKKLLQELKTKAIAK